MKVTAIPTWTPELGIRIGELFDALGGASAAGRLVGYTDEQVRKWRDGRAKAPFYALAAMTAAAGWSLDWLATGEGTREVGAARAAGAGDAGAKVDPQLLRDSIRLVEDWLERNNRVMRPERKAAVVADIYQLTIDMSAGKGFTLDLAWVDRILRLVETSE